ncbi:coiled-coil domain-containing protein 81-like isoform X2 [Manacus vitellinus]|uniref:coiled-coil domain-containing protein 81-like isoform X2 n=1 Tax=Manacus vitellinus TaxID=328815 RepID=UPI00115EEB66|nr:coiled-coil domain-containing protein 81-like isoform X2 [Manacus vitellinus]
MSQSGAPHHRVHSTGVLVPGLGTFAVVPEQVDGAEEVYVVRRPVFQLDMDVSCLRELMFPTVMIPGDIEIAPLDYWWLSQTTSLPPDVLRDCVEETVLLYSFQLRDRQRLAFAFGDIGVLSCQDNVLCMQFNRSCVKKLENWDTWVALLLTVSWNLGTLMCWSVSKEGQQGWGRG